MALALAAPMQGQTYIGTFQFLTSANQPAVVIAVPVTDEDQVIGTVEALVSLRRITEIIREEEKATSPRSWSTATASADPQRAVGRRAAPDFSNLKNRAGVLQGSGAIDRVLR